MEISFSEASFLFFALPPDPPLGESTGLPEEKVFTANCDVSATAADAFAGAFAGAGAAATPACTSTTPTTASFFAAAVVAACLLLSSLNAATSLYASPVSGSRYRARSPVTTHRCALVKRSVS